MRLSARTHVVVAGGGVAALETCLALRALAGDRAFVTLIAPDPYFTYRPIGVHDPLAARGLVRVPLARLARDASAELRHDRITGVDPAARRVRTASGCELAYDVLVLAIGATAIDAPAGAVPLADSAPVLRELAGGDIRSVAFVEPAAPARSLDLYHLALEAARAAGHPPPPPRATPRAPAPPPRAGGGPRGGAPPPAAPGRALAPAGPAPPATAGAGAADPRRVTPASHGIRLVESEHVRAVADGELDLAPGPRRVFAER